MKRFLTLFMILGLLGTALPAWAHTTTITDQVEAGLQQPSAETVDEAGNPGSWCFVVTAVQGHVKEASVFLRAVAGDTEVSFPIDTSSEGKLCSGPLPAGSYGVSLQAGPGQPGSSITISVEHPEREAAWEDAGRLLQARDEHTTTLLNDGRLLIAGGIRDCSQTYWYSVAVCPSEADSELFDVETGRSTGAFMLADRYGHTATLLSDGRVLVLGGTDVLRSDVQINAEVFDPATDSWRPAGALRIPRYNHSATLLPSGKILVVGGWGLPVTGLSSTTAELFDPASGISTLLDTLPSAQVGHEAVTLEDGRVLIAGGNGNDGEGALIFDPVTLGWSETAPMAIPRGFATATLLQDGRVLVTGGWRFGLENSSEVYDPARDVWVPAASLPGRDAHSATLLPDGSVLVVGGRSWDSTERYDPASDSWETMAQLRRGRGHHTTTLLSDGSVLVVGGLGRSGGREALVERLQP